MYPNTFSNINFDHDDRDHVRILISGGLIIIVIDCLFLTNLQGGLNAVFICSPLFEPYVPTPTSKIQSFHFIKRTEFLCTHDPKGSTIEANLYRGKNIQSGYINEKVKIVK